MPDSLSSFATTLITALSHFQFLRPWYWLAIVPACIAAWRLYRYHSQSGDWSRVIAPQLLPWLLDNEVHSRARQLPLIALGVWLIAILALSGPSWKDIPVPIQQSEQALVILLDLSPSMLATDLKPNRLVRARLKLLDLLQARQEGLSALIVYAGSSHVVTPLTDDTDTIATLVPMLAPDVMPMSGSSPELAVEKALQLLANAGHQRGDILLITDGIAQSAVDTIDHLLADADGVTLSILGVGTAQGAPIPGPSYAGENTSTHSNSSSSVPQTQGNFYKDPRGNIVIARFDPRESRRLAADHQGIYTDLRNDDRDITLIQSLSNTRDEYQRSPVPERTFDMREDQGYWLAILLLPFALLAFRRNFLAALILLPLAVAPPHAQAFDWDDLWLRDDQQGAKALQQDDPASAQQHFTTPDWQGSAAYRNGDYESATSLFEQTQSADGHFNRGNALAQLGNYDAAIDAYQQALSLDPTMSDAEDNRKLLEALKQQEQQEQQDKNQENPDSSESENNKEETDDRNDSDKDQSSNSDGSDSQSPDSQKPDPQDPDTQSPDAQNPASKNQEPQDSETERPKPPSENPEDTDEQRDSPNKDANEDKTNDPASEQQDQTDSEPEVEESRSEEQSASKIDDTHSEEQKQAHEQWLRSLPDASNTLLRRKFRHEVQTRPLAPPPTGEQRW